MAALTSVEARRDLFRQHVLRSGDFAVRYSRERRHDDEALARQRDNILQAMDACERYAAASQTVVDIALSLHDHMERRGHWAVWEKHLERAVAASRKVGNARVEGTLLNHLGEIRRDKGRWASALALHEEALRIFERLQDETGRARSHQHLGCSWWLRGRWDRASEHFEVALSIAQGLDEEGPDLVDLYRDLGRLSSYEGKWEEALGYLRRAAQMASRLGDAFRQIRACNSMGYAHWRRGEWAEARRVLQWAMEAAEQRSYETRAAIACNNMAAVLLSQGAWEEALAYLKRDLKIVERIGAVHLAAHAYDDMGEAYRQAGQWREAWQYLERSAAIKRQLDDLSGLAATYHHLGLLCTDVGEHKQAVGYHRQALALRERLRGKQDIAEVLVSLAGAYYHHFAALRLSSERRRAEDEMRSVIGRAWTLGGRLGRSDLLTRLLWLKAEVALAEGSVEGARGAYERALEISGDSTGWCSESHGCAYANDRLVALHRETRTRLEALKDHG